MCLEEYTQEYVNELHEIELERFKKRADKAEAGLETERNRADQAEARANKAEADCEAEKNRADDAETKLARYREKYGIID